MGLIDDLRLYRLVTSLIDKIRSTTVVNWKTTAAAVIVAIPLILKYVGYPLSPDLANAIQAVAVSLGLIMAKDRDVTGGTRQQ